MTNEPGLVTANARRPWHASRIRYSLKSWALGTSDRAPDQPARMAVPAESTTATFHMNPLVNVVERAAVEEVAAAAGEQVDGLPVVGVDRPMRLW